MYMSRMLEVGKAENGFVVQCNVPLKPENKGKGKDMPSCVDSTEKMYLAKTEAEVGEIIGKLMPLLDGEYTSEADFDSAFDEAAKNMPGMEKEESNEA